ncbi:MAG: TCP-1/cpn60 chaperonin family protein [Methanophagales archaeon]|nr:TCP-1/cpn60 chaperonin family protein [Methanophagales archaeon]
MAGQLGGTPILVLREGSERASGKDAQSANINAAKAVGAAVRTALGPKGMDKMLVGSLGDVVMTNDGVTILKEMEIESPAAKMMVEVAKTVDAEAGDGTTASVVLACELLKNAEELLEQGLHPVVIAGGYRLAADQAMKVLDAIAIDIAVGDKDEEEEELKSVVETAITGKFSRASRDALVKIAIKAVKAVVEEDSEGKQVVDVDNISIEKKVGGRIDDTELVQGMVLDKEIVHPGMPRQIENAKIALINSSLEIKKTETSAEVKIKTSEQLKSFLAEEEQMMLQIAKQIKEIGANVVICQKGIDDVVQHYLAREGIIAIRRAKKSDMEKLEKATGGKIVNAVNEITESDLGHAGLVEERKIAGDKMFFIEQCKNPRAVSIVISGGTEQVVDELERSLHDMLRVTGSIIEDGKAVAGGGAVESELALKIRGYSASVSGREQLAVEKFADAMEIIPRTLAENSGLDPIDKLVALKAAHESGEKNAGLNIYTGEIVDMRANNVIEPLRTKRQLVASAVEAAIMILRIDDVITSKKEETAPAPPTCGEGMPCGAGAGMGMPGGMPPY